MRMTPSCSPLCSRYCTRHSREYYITKTSPICPIYHSICRSFRMLAKRWNPCERYSAYWTRELTIYVEMNNVCPGKLKMLASISMPTAYQLQTVTFYCDLRRLVSISINTRIIFSMRDCVHLRWKVLLVKIIPFGN